MADVIFTDNRISVKAGIDKVVIAWLHEAGGELEAQVKRNSRVDTGQTKGSWKYAVDSKNHEAVVGSPLENAMWEEFGTGEYALNGDGRKTPWKYKDRYGKWHKTKGKTPSRPLHRAVVSRRDGIIAALENALRGL